MRGAIPPLPQYVLMACKVFNYTRDVLMVLCLGKKRGKFTFIIKVTYSHYALLSFTTLTKIAANAKSRTMCDCYIHYMNTRH
jgi:hypothetical protein